jgi:uncharacterized HhH-GPD family protein
MLRSAWSPNILEQRPRGDYARSVEVVMHPCQATGDGPARLRHSPLDAATSTDDRVAPLRGNTPIRLSRVCGVADLHLSGDVAADELLSTDPLALLIGMVLDQQIPLEWAFSGPRRLKDRLDGRLDAADLAAMDPEQLGKVFAERPALHRFPGSNAKRVQALTQIVVDEYDGDASRIWSTAATGTELYRRVKALPGFGEQKAKIFVALLGKQLGVTPPGWQEAAGPYGHPGTLMSVADITGPDTLAEVRNYKRAKKAAAKAAADA